MVKGRIVNAQMQNVKRQFVLLFENDCPAGNGIQRMPGKRIATSTSAPRNDVLFVSLSADFGAISQ